MYKAKYLKYKTKYLSLKSSSKNNIMDIDRLTDTRGYTGAHKHRFDADGRGKGIAGRDS